MSNNIKNEFFVEVTDTFGNEANYCWVRRYRVAATTPRGAICKVSRETGYQFRFDGVRYNAQGACVCAFVDDFDPDCHRYYSVISL